MTNYARTIDYLLKEGFFMRMYQDDNGIYFVSFIKDNTTITSFSKSWRGAVAKAGRQIET